MKPINKLLPFVLAVVCLSACGRKETGCCADEYLAKAKETMSAIYEHYSAPDTPLLIENYPVMDTLVRQSDVNEFSFLWPFSGTLSATTAIMKCDPQYSDTLIGRVLPALEQYYDDIRTPPAYSSYINTAPPADRYYDDNIWLGLDFVDLYEITGEKEYLDKAKSIWDFIESGYDDVLGGGIYWCEQEKRSKNTCSNAPASVLALKLYHYTDNDAFLKRGKEIYEWTDRTFRDTTDNLYFDNMSIGGKMNDWKFAYNSGQMIQAGTMLYNITGEKSYLDLAQKTARSCYDMFFREYPEEGDSTKILAPGRMWFKAIMFRGLVELYNTDGDPTYVDAVRNSLDVAWENARTEQGLFYDDCSGQRKSEPHWLLVQGAMAEMYARAAALEL